MTTSISRELCIGCELCPSLSPELYAMDSEGKAVVVKTGPLSEQEGIEAHEAADSCPVNAIGVEDD